MNTMPQAFDPRPQTRAGFSVSGPGPAPSRAAVPRRPEPRLKLVGGAAEALAEPRPAPAVAEPYDLSRRRHLARVPELQPAPAQDGAAPADNPDSAAPWARRELEPLVFALVLLVSVAALAVAMRAG